MQKSKLPKPKKQTSLLPEVESTFDDLLQKPTTEHEMRKLIREMGLKVTEPRMAILKVLVKGPRHMSGQEVFELAKKISPEVGFATVYRFLAELTAKAFLSEVRMGGGSARYEWISQAHHDHMSCTKCGRIVEFEDQMIEKLQEKVAIQLGFLLTGHVLELYGLCSKCH